MTSHMMAYCICKRPIISVTLKRYSKMVTIGKHKLPRSWTRGTIWLCRKLPSLSSLGWYMSVYCRHSGCDHPGFFSPSGGTFRAYYSGTLPYDHLINTTTSLLRPLYSGPKKSSLSIFPTSRTPLIRPPRKYD